MNQTTDTSRLLTIQDARVQTAQLIAQCPDWCTEQHDPTEHPEDVVHRTVAARSPWGDITVNVYPLPLGESPSSIIYVPEDRNHGDMTRAQALAMASALLAAADKLDEINAGVK